MKTNDCIFFFKVFGEANTKTKNNTTDFQPVQSQSITP